MSESPTRRISGLIAAATAAVAMLFALTAEAGAAPTVTIQGNAYAFIFAGNESRLEGAKIGVAEIPDLTTTAGPNGAYALEVPDDRTITPYAEIDGYYTTHLQTFHTSGRDLKQVNFQMPELGTYSLLAAVVQAEQDDEGKLSKCGIVSTFFERQGRSFADFDDFHDFRPHGVIGSTAVAIPAAGRQLYFNDAVIPDPAQESSSRDGGVLWLDVESGVYEIEGRSGTTRHSSFVATCEPGRLVNANPPWGLYELAGNEEVNPAALPDTEVNAALLGASAIRSGRRNRRIRLRVKTSEPLAVRVRVRQPARQPGLTIRRSFRVGPGRHLLYVKVRRALKAGAASARVKLVDDAGNSTRTRVAVSIPRAVKKKRPRR